MRINQFLAVSLYDFEQYQFRYDFTDLYIDTIKERFEWLNKVYKSYNTSTVPLIDEDPNSPNFGLEVIELDSVGVAHFIYEKFPLYFWVDFEPKFFYVHAYDYDDSTRTTHRYFGQLLMTKEFNGKNQIIGTYNPSNYFREKYFSTPPTILQESNWYRLLESMINNYQKKRQ